MNAKKISALLLAAVMAIPCAAPSQVLAAEAVVEEAQAAETKTPKYIFLFIGDGMSYPQIQTTNYYLNAIEDDGDDILTSESKLNMMNFPVAGSAQTYDSTSFCPDSASTATSISTGHKTGDDILTSESKLNMMNFPVAGSAQTYDSTSFCPDSASTATSISTGHKTYSGTINMDEKMETPYETIAEKLKKQLGYKVGILSTVNLNHATPAAFYAHQASRNSYYEIGQEMISSEFDYFAGGGLKKVTGDEGDKTDLYQLAQEAGYKVVKTQAEAEALTAEDGKTIVIDETLADDDAMSYDMDREEGEWRLADYVEKGIDVLDNDTGFFMMVEGGKIDWACHANDAAATITDTVAMDEAVGKAVEFYNEHPEETLILVTGDHETGGLTIGFAGTDYDTFLTNISNQKISYAKFDSDYVAGYKENKTDFE